METQNKQKALEDLLFLTQFVMENSSAGKLTEQKSNEIESLWNEYKLTTVTDECAIICADFGELGSLHIQYISEVIDPIELKYESGSYDYVSVRTERDVRILWTDYENVEPYNRQAGLYANGASFRMLGEPVVQKADYREFQSDSAHGGRTMFGVHGYRYNDFYGSVRFGICLKKEQVSEFVEKLRNIIGK